MKIYRIMGKRGRTTIPYALREKLGIEKNSVLSFAEGDDGRTIIVKKERICDCEKAEPTKKKDEEEITLLDFLNDLPEKLKRAALIHLTFMCGKAKTNQEV